MITQTRADKLANSWLNAWNGRDIGKIMTHYADDIALIHPFVSVLLGKTDGKIYRKAV